MTTLNEAADRGAASGSTSRRRGRSIALLLVLTLLTAACTGGGALSSEPVASGSPTAPTADVPTVKPTAESTPGVGQLTPADPPRPASPTPSDAASTELAPMAVLAPVPTASSDDDKDPSLGLTITFAGDFQDLTSTQRDDVPPQDLPESSIIYDEQFEDRPSAILQPFEAEPARGLFGNFDEVFFYDMVVGEPDSVLTNPVMDVAPEDLIDIALVTSSFAQNFDGPPDVSTGLFCWGAGTDGSGIPDQSRYELRVQPDRRMVVDRVDPDGQISARLIEITLPLPPDRATFARLGCRRGAGGRVEIIAGYTQGEEGDTLYNIDPQPLRPGGTAGILMRTGENPVSASTFISFVQLVLFDANAIVLGE